MDWWTAIAAEREELAGFLATLEPAEWDAPSLCTQWRVRDVVGHMVAGATTRTSRSIANVVRYGFRVNALISAHGIEIGSRPAPDLLASYRETIGSRRHLSIIPPPALLTDVVVHAQDIRRPLGKRRVIPEAHARAVAKALRRNVFLGVPRRIRGLRLRATDLDWTHGDGPEVAGPIEALIVAMAGRAAALDDLTGEGKATLAARYA